MGENLLQREKLKHLIDKVFNDTGILRKGGEEAVYFCFNCHHYKRKIEINLDSQKWACWVCHVRGNSIRSLFYKLKAKESYFDELYKIVGKTWVKREELEDRKIDLSLPDEFIPLWKPSKFSDYGLAISYLHDRNIMMDDILRYNIGFCESGEYRQRVLVPSYDKDGNVNFFAARTFQTSNPYKYLLSPWSKNIIGFELFINWSEEITLVESPFNAITIRNNSIPLFGTIVSNKLKEKIILSGIPRVNIALDNDEAGVKGSLKIYDFLQGYDIDIYFVKLTKKDPNEVGFEKMCELIENAERMDFHFITKKKLEYI